MARTIKRGVQKGLPSTTFPSSTISKSGAGFTLLDLLVSATVLIIIFSFVLANFRTGQKSGEIEVALKQVIDGITTVRTMSLGGQLINGDFPAGGYAIHFNLQNPSQYILYQASAPAASYHPGAELPNGISPLKEVKLVSLCGLDQDQIISRPCQNSDWDNSTNPLEIIFSLANEIFVNPATDEQSGLPFKYVGGVIEHQKTGQQSYFYISLVSGLVTGDSL